MNKFILFLISLFSLSGIYAQDPEIEWQNTIGGFDDDDLYSLQQTSDGGFILGGKTRSGFSGDKTEPVIGSDDYWVVKLSEDGSIEWQNTIGGTSSDELEVVRQTFDGGFIVGGSSKSNISGDKTENKKGPLDYWIVKLDILGNIEWENTIGGSGSDNLTDMIQTVDGGYLIGGYSDSGISGDKTENSQGGYDYWVIKLDATGSIIWQNTIGGNYFDYLTCMVQTADGGYIIGGNSPSLMSGDKTEGNIGYDDIWIIKLNAIGNIIWQNTIGGTSTDNVNDIIQDDDGNYFLAATSNSDNSGDKMENCRGEMDYWVVKLNTAGNIVAQNTIGGNGTDLLYSLDIATDGGYLLGGDSRSGDDGDKEEINLGSGYPDYWLIKLDAGLNIVWQNTIGGSHEDIYLGSDIVSTIDGGLIAGGSSRSEISADKTEEKIGGSDFWILKFAAVYCGSPVDIFSNNITATTAAVHWNAIEGVTKYQISYRPTGGGVWLKKNAASTAKNLTTLLPNTTYEYKIKTICTGYSSPFSALYNFTTLPLKESDINIYKENAQLNIYPNPTKNVFTISGTGEIGVTTMLMYNNLGQLIYSKLIKSVDSAINEQIEIGYQPPGIYLVKLYCNNYEFVQKLIIE